MPKTLDHLFATVSDDVAARTRMPGAEAAIATSRRGTAVIAAASIAAVLVGVVLVGALLPRGSEVQPSPAAPTGVPVWYDRDGLHYGEAVFKTPVSLDAALADGESTPLTLVRSGALYLDTALGEVWFHPWGGKPQIVGQDSAYGPTGDPESDTAAWFEGSELVVYDTAAAQEIARVVTSPVRCCVGAEHLPVSNGFMQVSPDAVVWSTEGNDVLRLELQTMQVDELIASTSQGDSYLADLHDQTQLWSSRGDARLQWGLSLRTPSTEEFYSDLEATAGRLSPDGRFLLGVTKRPHGSAFVDLQDLQVEPFSLPNDPFPDEAQEFYAWIAWSYGNTSVMIVRDADYKNEALLTCNPVLRECDWLPSNGNVILPSS